MLGLRLSVPALGRTAWHHTFPCKFPKSDQKRLLLASAARCKFLLRQQWELGEDEASLELIRHSLVASTPGWSYASISQTTWSCTGAKSRMTKHTLKDVFCDMSWQFQWLDFQHLSTYFNHFQFHNWKLECRLHHSSSPSQIQRNLDSGSLKLNRTQDPLPLVFLSCIRTALCHRSIFHEQLKPPTSVRCDLVWVGKVWH